MDRCWCFCGPLFLLHLWTDVVCVDCCWCLFGTTVKNINNGPHNYHINIEWTQFLWAVIAVFVTQLCVPPVVAQTVGIQTRQQQLTQQLQVDSTGGTNIWSIQHLSNTLIHTTTSGVNNWHQQLIHTTGTQQWHDQQRQHTIPSAAAYKCKDHQHSMLQLKHHVCLNITISQNLLVCSFWLEAWNHLQAQKLARL